jgi:hypothetical protein
MTSLLKAMSLKLPVCFPDPPCDPKGPQLDAQVSVEAGGQAGSRKRHMTETDAFRRGIEPRNAPENSHRAPELGSLDRGGLGKILPESACLDDGMLAGRFQDVLRELT